MGIGEAVRSIGQTPGQNEEKKNLVLTHKDLKMDSVPPIFAWTPRT